MSVPTRRGVVAGGNWIVDHVKVIDAWPPQDALANILAETRGNGGSPYNLLINLARLGAPFPLKGVGLIGDDADGAFIRDDLHRWKIGTEGIQTVSAASTSFTDVMTVKGTGRRTFFHQRGANALLGPEHFSFSESTEQHFHLGYALLLDRLDQLEAGTPAMARVFASARAAGLSTSLDCVSESSDRFSAVVRPVLPEVDLFFANDYEAQGITGISLRQDERLMRSKVEMAAGRLLEFGVREWVILHFPEGALAASRSGQRVWQGSVRLPAAEIQGAAGAGDAFAAGVIYGFHEQWPMEQCLRLGVCVAAACLRDVTCSGGVTSMPVTESLGFEWGFRSFSDEG